MRYVRVALCALAITSASACASNAPVSCEVAETDPPVPLTCDMAVAIGRQELAAFPGVTALRFTYEECAPNQRTCSFLFGTVADVIATLSDGSEVAVFVRLNRAGTIQAERPRPFTRGSAPTPLPEG